MRGYQQQIIFPLNVSFYPIAAFNAVFNFSQILVPVGIEIYSTGTARYKR